MMGCKYGRIVKLAMAAAACAALAATAGVAQAADVGISLSFSQPGVYGRVDIGQFPQPQVILAQPVLVAPPPPAMPPPEPVYLWVPLEHRRHWDRYCGQYHACGHPVYFVNHVWYKNNVMAHRDERREHGRSEEDHGRHEGHEAHDNHGRHEGHDGREGRGEGHDHDR
jgi:hypothetical protein